MRCTTLKACILIQSSGSYNELKGKKTQKQTKETKIYKKT